MDAGTGDSDAKVVVEDVVLGGDVRELLDGQGLLELGDGAVVEGDAERIDALIGKTTGGVGLNGVVGEEGLSALGVENDVEAVLRGLVVDAEGAVLGNGQKVAEDKVAVGLGAGVEGEVLEALHEAGLGGHGLALGAAEVLGGDEVAVGAVADGHVGGGLVVEADLPKEAGLGTKSVLVLDDGDDVAVGLEEVVELDLGGGGLHDRGGAVDLDDEGGGGEVLGGGGAGDEAKGPLGGGDGVGLVADILGGIDPLEGLGGLGLEKIAIELNLN